MADAALHDDVPASGADAERRTESAYHRYRRLVPWAVGLSLATLIGLSVYYQSRGGDVLGELRRVDPRALVAALALHLLMQVLWGVRIHTLGRGLGARTSLGRAWALVCSGLFAAAVTPGRVGGEPWRIAMLVRGGAPGVAASRTILADRAVDMLFFIVLGLAAVVLLPSFFGEDLGRVRILGILAIAGLSLLVVVLTLALVRPAPVARGMARAAALPARLRRRPAVDRAPAIQAFFREVTSGIADLMRRRPLLLLAGAGLSLLLWTCELSILWVVLQGFGHDTPYPATFLASVLIVMVASVPALPGGTGTAEVAALALLTPLAPGLSPAFLVAWRGMTYYVDLVLGGLVAGIVARRSATAPLP